MFNAYLLKKGIEKQNIIQKLKYQFVKEQLDPENNNMSIKAIKRAKMWTENQNEDASQILQNGIHNHIHESLYSFRKNCSEKNIYVRHYLPEKHRVPFLTSIYNSAFYKKEPFDINQPNLTNGLWLRLKFKEKQIKGNMKYKNQNDSCRLKDALNNSKYLNTEPLNVETLTNPQWKINEKKSNITNIGFRNIIRKSFSGKNDIQAWNTNPNYLFKNPFLGGFKETGFVFRKNSKEKNISSKPFISSNSSDTWKKELLKSQSLRTYLSNVALRKIKSPKIYVKKLTDNGKDILQFLQKTSKQNSKASERLISKEKILSTMNKFYLKSYEPLNFEKKPIVKNSQINDTYNNHLSISKLVQTQFKQLNTGNILELTLEKECVRDESLSSPKSYKRISSRNTSQNEGT